MNKLSAVQRGSPDRFGYEWDNYSSLEPIYEEQFLKWTPFLMPTDWKGLSFLDVGCGMGRNSYWPLVYGAKEGVAIDIDSRTLASARETLKSFINISIEYRSIYDLQESNKFDIAFSIGVIHHLESPILAIKKMTEAVKSGGRVMIWVYGYENNEWIVNIFNPFRTALFSRLPVALVHHLSLYPTLFLYPILRIFNFKSKYLNLLKKFSFRHLRSIVFDQMLPVIANYWTREQVSELMHGADLTNVEIQMVNDMSWAAIGTKV